MRNGGFSALPGCRVWVTGAIRSLWISMLPPSRRQHWKQGHARSSNRQVQRKSPVKVRDEAGHQCAIGFVLGAESLQKFALLESDDRIQHHRQHWDQEIGGEAVADLVYEQVFPPPRARPQPKASYGRKDSSSSSFFTRRRNSSSVLKRAARNARRISSTSLMPTIQAPTQSRLTSSCSTHWCAQKVS